MIERDLVYLACPYSDDEKVVREARFLQATKAAAHLIKHGHVVYSPITHCHPMKKHAGLPQGWNFWRRLDETYLQYSKLLIILPLEGWRRSIGVRAEIQFAKEQNIPITYLHPDTFEFDWEQKYIDMKYEKRTRETSK